MAAPKAPKFKPGDKVKYPKHPDDLFPAGTGTVASVKAGKAGAPDAYRVKSDATDKLLPAEFYEGELTKV